MPDYAKLAEAARNAVTSASGVCRQVQGALDELRAITKDDKSPVTVGDFASQAIIARSLTDALGPIRLVGEEDSAFLCDPEHAAHLEATLAAVQEVWSDATQEQMLDAIDIGTGDAKGGFWTLDPIDGTKGFLRGQQYAIALAYVEDGRPVVGVMGCPNLPVDLSEPFDVPHASGCLYWAIRGDGVYETSCTDPHAESIRITRLDHDPGDEICVTGSVERAHSSRGDTGRVIDWLKSERGVEAGEPARLDSQCKYAVVARGQADAYLRLPRGLEYVERIWDHAAGSLIAAESGAAVSDIYGHELDFSQGRGLEKNKGVVSAPPRLHGDLIAAIEALGIGR